MNIRNNTLISEGELNTIYEKMCLKSKKTGLNPYETYIQDCKLTQSSKVDDQGNKLIGVERHHITPRFDGGSDDANNLVLLTVKEHVIAHWLRWKVLGKSQDLSAFLFRIGDTEKALELRRQAILDARERDKINKQGFFNSDFQREMGSRGGSVGGSKNTERQYLARQRVGLTHGRQTGLGNQGNGLGQFVSSFSIWAYSAKVASKPRGASRTDEQMYLVSPKQAFVDITKTLNTFVPGSVRTPSAMHKVVYGERAQMYGWRIVNTLTRSEIREGILNFMQNNPTVVLQFEEDLTVIEGFE